MCVLLGWVVLSERERRKIKRVFLSFFLSLQSFLCSKNHRHWWVWLWLWLWYSLLTFFFFFSNFLKFHFFLLIFFDLSRRFWNSKQNFPEFCFVLIHFLLTYEYCFYLLFFYSQILKLYLFSFSLFLYYSFKI